MAAWDADEIIAPAKKAKAAWEADEIVGALPVAGGEPMSRTGKVLAGMADPIHGSAQLLTKMLPDSVVSAGNAANNWLADTTGLVARLPEGGVDQQVREREAAYQAQRAAAGESGFDGYRAIGNVLSPANAALATKLPAAATMLGRIGVGAGGGAASAAMNPVTSGDFVSEKGKQLALGAAFGAAVPAVVGGVARVVSPRASVNPQVQTLRAEGVRPTVGQTLGGMANALEEKATSIPLVGDMIAHTRRGATQDLNRAAFNRALRPIGMELPPGVTGREAVQLTEDAISAQYNRLLPGMTVRTDAAFVNELQQLRAMVNTGSLDPNAARAFNRILQNDVLSKFRGRNALTGETFKAIEGDLGSHVRRLAGSQDADQRLVGDALQELQASMRGMLERSNPAMAGELRAANTAWANFKRVQKAAAGLGTDDGVFTAAQLQSAVKALDRSKDKARFAEGNALMQDLSGAAKNVLGNKVPDSGTAGRVMLGGGAGAAAFLDPTGAVPALLGGGAAAYSRPMQNALTALIAERPDLAQPIANALRAASPALIPAGAQIGLSASK